MTKATRTWCASLAVAGAVLSGCGESDSTSGDAVRGGALYDSWWAVTGQGTPTGNHALWAFRPDTTSNSRTGADTWRCKECHGWDYRGVDGAYGSGSHRTGIKGVLGTARSASEIAALLANPHSHAYGTVLDEQDLADVAAFVKEAAIDTSRFINSDGKFKGDAGAGAALFGRCASCHGSDGLTAPPGHADFEDFPGLIANENPQEFLHKARFGQPGTEMPPQADVLSEDELARLGAYVQTLPQQR